MNQRQDGYVREYIEWINKLDEYERQAKKRLDAQVTIWSTEEYDQRTLEKLIPKR